MEKNLLIAIGTIGMGIIVGRVLSKSESESDGFKSDIKSKTNISVGSISFGLKKALKKAYVNMEDEEIKKGENSLFLVFRDMNVAPYEMDDDHNWELEIDQAIDSLKEITETYLKGVGTKASVEVTQADKNYFTIELKNISDI